MAKDTRIAFRASEELKERLGKAAKSVRLSETALAEACVEAVVEYIEKHGGIWLPLQVLSQREAESAKLLASSRTGSTAASPSGSGGVSGANRTRTLEGAGVNEDDPGEAGYKSKGRQAGKQL